jgi:hypothetical protein
MKKVLLGISLVAFMASATFAHDKEKGKEKAKCETSSACCKKGEEKSACCKDMEKQAKAEAKAVKKEDKKTPATPKKA